MVSLGAVKCNSPKCVGLNSDIVILCLPDSNVVESVVYGKEGLIHGLSKGNILIDMSTSKPDSTRKIHEDLYRNGVRMLDAPVSGGPSGAEKGTLSIMVGGDITDYDECKTIFEVIGENIYHIGTIGSGHSLKAVNNLLYGSIFVATCEAIVLGVKSGIDPSILLDVISKSSGRNHAVDVKFKNKVLNRDFEAGFTTDLLLKDMNIAMEMAENSDYPMDVCMLARDSLVKGQQEGLGGLDHSALVGLYEAISGITVKK